MAAHKKEIGKMTMYKIEKNKPLSSKLKYPFADMRIDDSFFVPDQHKQGAGVVSSAHYYGKRNGKKFATRYEDGGIRIWRVK